MKIKEGQVAPAIETTDVNGNKFSLEALTGKKILLTFYRNVGCPICNVRFHELQQETPFFKENNVVLVSIYESSAKTMRAFIENEDIYSIMIPNPAER